MTEQLNHVETFQKAFNRPVRYTPSLISEQEYKLRFGLLKEENEEYLEACENNDLVEIADALGDQLYIVFGSILEHGLQYIIAPIFEEIQRSNMSKLGRDGKPVINGENGVLDPKKDLGKVLKGVDFTAPNLKQFL